MKFVVKYISTRLAEDKKGKLHKTVKEWSNIDEAVAYARRYSHTANFCKVTVECPDEAEGYKVLFELESHGIVTVNHLGSHKNWLEAKQEELDDIEADHVAESGTEVSASGTMLEIRETMDTLGASFLSDAQLLAAITKTSPDKFTDDIDTVVRNPLSYAGIGKAKAATIEAVKELAKRLVKGKHEKTIVQGPDDVAQVLMPDYRYK